MKRILNYNGNIISYELNIKKVKNINLRIKADGNIAVSANKRVPKEFVDEFVLSKGEFILNSLEKYKKSYENKKEYFSDEEIKLFINDFCKVAYSYFCKFGILFPVIKFRKMTSMWGNCRAAKGILTFNTNLKYAPKESVEYVVWHEFTHFLQGNHSKKFYEELSKVCPDWKARRKILKEINLHENI